MRVKSDKEKYTVTSRAEITHHMIDFEESLDFTNWRTHPTQKKYRVIFYKTAQEAAYFETLLVEHRIVFERGEDETSYKARFLFAVSKDDMEVVKRLNNITIGRYRKKFIPNTYFRLVLIAISLAVLAIAIIGAILNS